ncbi:single-stranded DNA-binding protein [Cyanobium sp. Alchichica 3B3-8F6]|uniref:single-stranded DNA-binding protein n=1 Tax=Cyanobium sp. Alchichica 3B3-8F6 TaxID=2823696 RepID=UPI0020CDE8E5|nr:single-stranded DNA-binding protein [Cyanobium sp. Alchichica 3B3-8F6]MCP9881911.1 single-stranded DNA-binding protein [Cyanobium sp. Alchichica 3B3-8F6]
MNHCLLEVEVLEAPQVRYTQDNQTPVAEMAVQIDGLRPDDPPGQLKVVGWGNLAQELQNSVHVGQRLMLEGRLRMNTVTRQDGVKEKRAEFTLARLHPLDAGPSGMTPGTPSPATTAPAASATAPPVRRATGSGMAPAPGGASPSTAPPSAAQPAAQPPTWNTSPLVPDLPDDDDIPF